MYVYNLIYNFFPYILYLYILGRNSCYAWKHSTIVIVTNEFVISMFTLSIINGMKTNKQTNPIKFINS